MVGLLCAKKNHSVSKMEATVSKIALDQFALTIFVRMSPSGMYAPIHRAAESTLNILHRAPHLSAPVQMTLTVVTEKERA